MLNPTSGTLEEYISAIKNGNPSHVRITFPNQNITLTDENILFGNGITITSILNSEINLTVGMAISNQIVIEFLNSDVFTDFNWTEEFQVDFGVEMNGATNWVTVGMFTGVRPVKTQMTSVIVLTGYDRMESNLNISADSFVDTLTFPCTMDSIYQAISTETGISIELGDEIQSIMQTTYAENPFTYRGLTYRKILAWIAEANGCYARITADGKIQMKWYGDHTNDYVLTGDYYFDIDISDVIWQDSGDPKTWDDVKNLTWDEIKKYFWNELNGKKPGYAISAVWIKNDEKYVDVVYPVGYTDPIGVYSIIENPLLIGNDVATNAQNLFERLTDIGAYIPLTVDAIGNWMVETGDIIEIVYKNGNHIRMPIFTRTLRWNGNCSDMYECTGNIIRKLTNEESDRIKYNNQLANKYTIQSGVKIDEDGVTVSGGSYVKIVSGGSLDVDATNFKIDSSNKVVTAGNWSFNEYGVEFENANKTLNFYIRRKSNVANIFEILTRHTANGNDPVGVEFWHSALDGDEAFFLEPSNKSIINSIGFENAQFDRAYFKQYRGDGVKNNLTTTTEGYVLDARAGKELNDKIMKDTILYQASAVEHTFYAYNNSRNIIIHTGDGVTRTYIAMVYCASNGEITLNEIFKGTNVTSISTLNANRIEIKMGSASAVYARVINIRGDPMRNY